MELIPGQDGYTHINIYSKGKTELGRFLTNFALSPITTEDGDFKSIEGYWYWLSNQEYVMRELYGFNAKKIGKTFPRRFLLTDQGFQNKIRNACWIKIHSNQGMLNLFRTSDVPFTHYYVFNNGFVKDAGFKWLVAIWEEFRLYIRNNYQWPAN